MANADPIGPMLRAAKSNRNGQTLHRARIFQCGIRVRNHLAARLRPRQALAALNGDFPAGALPDTLVGATTAAGLGQSRRSDLAKTLCQASQAVAGLKRNALDGAQERAQPVVSDRLV